MTDPLDLDKLRRDAEAATQGEWRDSPDCLIIDTEQESICVCTFRRNTAHIANMDPPTTIALIDRLERAEQERDEAIAEYTDIINAGGIIKKLRRAEAALREIDEVIWFLRIPLENARRQGVPSAEPQNFHVNWVTSAVNVMQLLAWMDSRAALGEREGEP